MTDAIDPREADELADYQPRLQDHAVAATLWLGYASASQGFPLEFLETRVGCLTGEQRWEPIVLAVFEHATAMAFGLQPEQLALARLRADYLAALADVEETNL